MEINMAYSNKVLDHYENPRNVGKLDDKDENVGTGMVGAPACGDVMRLQIKVGADDMIEDAKFKTYGCGSAIASSSLLTEWVKGRSLQEATTIKNKESGVIYKDDQEWKTLGIAPEHIQRDVKITLPRLDLLAKSK